MRTEQECPKNYFDHAIASYEDWQLQCCGDPFSEGDIVEWTGDYAGEDCKTA